MQLKQGITIHSGLADIASQLTINEGTMRAGKATGLPYFPGSTVPKTKWRNLESTEAKLLVSPKPFTNFTKNIYIGEIPSALKKPLIDLGLHNCTQMDEVMPAIKEKEKEVKAVSKKLHTFLKPFSSTGNYKFHRITRAMPGWTTITRLFLKEKEELKFIGLHIDQSRPFTPYTAFKSDNRISVNLSKETRYLALINLTLMQVVNMIKERSGLPYEQISAQNITTLFFKYFPDYPAVKLAIKPYQYYIAPTDNFLHDASTLGNKELDITFVYVGLFDQPN